MAIHPTSFVSQEAEIDEGVEIGPFCVVKGRVKIGKGTVLESHAVVGSEKGLVEIGENNRIFPGACVGGEPQDKKYRGEETKLVLGDGNQIRECVTVSTGTVTGGGVTAIGDNNLIMAYCHFGHDSSLGNNNVIANSTQLAGHVQIGNHTIVGGMCATNQFVRIGDYAFIGGYSAINRDVLPFSIAQGNYAVVRATNKIGLERGGLSPQEIESIHKAIRIVSKGLQTLPESLKRIESECARNSYIEYLLDFIKSSERGLAI
jgi:UDP-N-acetylglucosamine acyltransferase